MTNLFFCHLLLGSSILLGLAGCEAGPATRQPAAHPAPAVLQEQEPLLSEAEAQATIAAIQQATVLPFGTPVPAESSQVVVHYRIGNIGVVEDIKIGPSSSPVVDDAVWKAALTHLPSFTRYRLEEHEQLAYSLCVRAPGAATPDQRREATTRWQQTTQRWPGETDGTFVQRVLPLSYNNRSRDLLTRAWRPSAFGKQLFFTLPSCERYCGYSTVLLVLDPYQENTYAVQELVVPSQGDDTDLVDLFQADVNHDGRPELLAIGVCCLRGSYGGCHNNYRTEVWHYIGPDPAGRPRYKADETERPYLNDLATPAAVRRALARHRRRQASRPLVPHPDSTARM
ncbi:MAG: hypothetical protein ACRYFZ_22240 [Janthinobacterium lividum]